jgi:organic radical activating enzyme
MAGLECPAGGGYDGLFLFGWAIGKRCNFACSYCSKEFHDRISPHRSFDELRDVWSNVKRQIAPRNMAAAVEFTGGEPTLNPDFLDLVRYLDLTQRSALRWMGTTTNGTQSLQYYEELTEHLDWICFSTHFEWWNEHDFMTTLLDLKRALAKRRRQPDINVNLMYETWSLDQVEKIKAIVAAEGITNLPIMVYNEYGSKGIRNKNSQPFDYSAYLKDRDGIEQAAIQTHGSDASAETMLAEHSGQVDNPDMQLTLDDGQRIPVHAQILVNLHLNKFPGWRCNAGIDRIFINTDGMVYGGMCKAVQLGDMLSEFKLLDKPVVCDGRECFCMSDVRIKKWKE